MNISKIIERFGYKLNEVKVYLAALQMAESTISGIAIRVGLPLSSAQVAIEKLHKDGLVNFYIRKHRRYWVAEQPEKLVQILKEKEEELTLAIKDVKFSKKRKDKPIVGVFIGADEIKLIHDNMIQKKCRIRAIIPWESWSNLLGLDYLNDFMDLCARHFLNLKILVPKTVDTMKLKEKDLKELRQTKFIPGNILIEDALFIFNDTVAIVILNEHQPTGVVLEDSATTRMMSLFFEDVWERGSE